MRNGQLTPNIWVRLPQSDLDNLDYIASELPGNRSDHARQAIKEYIHRVLPSLRTARHVADIAELNQSDITLRETA